MRQGRPSRTLALLGAWVLVLCVMAPATASTADRARTGGANETVAGEATSFDTSSPVVTGDVYTGLVRDGLRSLSTDGRYVRIIETRDEANSTFNFELDDENELTFVNGTDFTTSYLVVYQEVRGAPRSGVTIESAVRNGSTLRVSLNETCPRCAVTQVVVLETVMMRFERNESQPRPSFVVVDGLNSSYTRLVEGHVVSSLVLAYDRNGNQQISMEELDDAAADYRAGELTLDELSQVAAAYARSDRETV